jgi:hypothetical protein
MIPINTDKPPLIYESPDGGKTIWARVSGQIDRHLVRMAPDSSFKIDKLREIVKLAETDPEISELLAKLEVVYELKRNR